MRQLAARDDKIEVPGIGDRGPRMLSKELLANVIEPRVEELLTLVQAELRRSGFEEQISSGIVLTGGTSLMRGMVELGEEIFHLPVRIGVPEYQGGFSERVRSPRFATSVGLLMAGLERHAGDQVARIQGQGVMATLQRMKTWVQQNF